MTSSATCPCGSEKTYAQCCEPILQGKRKAATAEELLRARYTAFTQGAVDFIVSSHHSQTRDQVDRKEIEEWSKSSEWLGLKVLQQLAVPAKAGEPERHEIAFHAEYKTKGEKQDHYEHALFQKEGDEWKFLDAQPLKRGPMRRTEPKVGRNDPCTCGSGKKFKKCCGAGQAA